MVVGLAESEAVGAAGAPALRKILQRSKDEELDGLNPPGGDIIGLE
jgi:hypothetical protein